MSHCLCFMCMYYFLFYFTELFAQSEKRMALCYCGRFRFSDGNKVSKFQISHQCCVKIKKKVIFIVSSKFAEISLMCVRRFLSISSRYYDVFISLRK